MEQELFIDKIKSFEGFRSHAYLCPAGVWTIGYGRTSGVLPGSITTREKEDKWIREKLDQISIEIFHYSKDRNYDFKPYQIQALTSFVYNCGLGNLNKLTDYGKRDPEQISQKLPAYNKGGGKVLPGLVKRRAWEKDLFDGKLEEDPKKEKQPTAKDIQILANKISGADLVVDGKIGKESIRVIYSILEEVAMNG